MMNLESLRQLQNSLSRIDDLIRAAVQRAQEVGHDPTDALRGLIISPDEVDAHLKQSALAGFWPDQYQPPLPPLFHDKTSPDVPFLTLIEAFSLTLLDAYILLLALAPELDRRYERLYAYLQDDVSQRRPTVSLMMNLLGGALVERFAVWERLSPEMPLRHHHLIEALPDPSRNHPVFLSYHLKVDHRVISWLLGSSTADERLKDAVSIAQPGLPGPLTMKALLPLRTALVESPMVYFQAASGMGQIETARALCAEYGVALLVVDAETIKEAETSASLLWRLSLREAYLADAALMIDGWEHCLNEKRRPPQELWSALLRYPRPVFLSGSHDWEPQEVGRMRRMLRLNFSIPDYEARLGTWEQFAELENVRVPEQDLRDLAGKFRFTHQQIARAIHSAADIALSRGDSVNTNDLYAGAQSHAGLQLGHLATRILPRYTWEDLVLPPDQLTQLHEISARARYLHIVQDQWQFGKKVAHLHGVSALFAGESGTGKTLAAEVISRELGLVLYKIDLSAVVSKYIGETEKNLNVIFSEARSSNAILFFDEADALFGKRSEVKDARDRYANIEIAYLLQQIETYDGIAIMATNLRQNIDEAFTRRLDFLIDFPFPESEYRRLIWETHFPAEAPLGKDVNLAEIAERYHLAGGNIRNAALAAAFLAAADGGIITMMHIRHAIRREHQKMGRLLDGQF